MRIIDCHHHFWLYDSKEYAWIDDNMSAIRRDFLPKDLKATITPAEVEGVISVQARQLLEETEWLLKLASQNDFIKGVVGWVPLVDNEVEKYLDKFCESSVFKSVRHVVQGEPDDNFILGNDFNRGIKKLKKYGLTYDILIFEKHLPQTITFVDRHPEQIFVLDHIAKPKIKINELEPWTGNIRELAKRKNVYCKFSGMVTEADILNWTETQLQPYFEVILDAFGPERLMFGSDWPVCLVACEYQRWVEITRRFFSRLSKDEQELIFTKNTIKAYNL